MFGILSALEFRNIRVRREDKGREGFAAFSHITAPFKNKPFIQFLTAYSVFEFGLLLALPLFPLVQVDKAHIPNLVAGVFGTVFSGMWLAGFFFLGAIHRQASPVKFAGIIISDCKRAASYISSDI